MIDLGYLLINKLNLSIDKYRERFDISFDGIFNNVILVILEDYIINDLGRGNILIVY
jgi:hypothetical protein